MGNECPEVVTLLLFCEYACVAFSFEASMLSVKQEEKINYVYSGRNHLLSFLMIYRKGKSLTPVFNTPFNENLFAPHQPSEVLPMPGEDLSRREMVVSMYAYIYIYLNLSKRARAGKLGRVFISLWEISLVGVIFRPNGPPLESP